MTEPSTPTQGDDDKLNSFITDWTTLSLNAQAADPVDVREGWTAGIANDGRAYLQSSDFKHDARLYLDGDFGSADERFAYLDGIAARLVTCPEPDYKALAVKLAEALEPFAEGARLGSISGRPPFEFCGAADYENAETLLASARKEGLIP